MAKKVSSIGAARTKTVKLRTAKGRSTSSQRWLRRQLNDPYVQEAKRQGYRSRSAFKLIQLDQKFDLFKKGYLVVDLGAAPGGWTQIAADRINSKSCSGKVVGLDILPMEPISGATLLQADFMTESGYELLLKSLSTNVDVVLSDMCLPDINGLKMIEQMQGTQHNKHCQFHMMSGYFEQCEKTIKALDIVSCFDKPDDIFAMPEKIDNYRFSLS